jgi:hypothetical protein
MQRSLSNVRDHCLDPRVQPGSISIRRCCGMNEARQYQRLLDLVMKSDENTHRNDENLRPITVCGAPTGAPALVSVQKEPGIFVEVVERIGRGERI